METLSHSPFNDPGLRFALDNLLDGFKDESLVIWEAHDTRTGAGVWIIGRKVTLDGGLRVLPCAVLLPSGKEAVERYAPALLKGGWDYSQVESGKRIILPD
jgi:hypothetical protein